MCKIYYVDEHGNQQGPITLDQFASLHLPKETMVWKEGMISWKNAYEIEELIPYIIDYSPKEVGATPNWGREPSKGSQQQWSAPPLQPSIPNSYASPPSDYSSFPPSSSPCPPSRSEASHQSSMRKAHLTYLPAKPSFFHKLFHKKSVNASSTVFAPATSKPNEDIMIQVYVYKDEDYNNVCQDAVQADSFSSERSSIPLNFSIKKGDKIDFRITIYGMEQEQPVKSLIWQGRYTKTCFFVSVPKSWNRNIISCQIFMSVNGATLGEHSFFIHVNNCSKSEDTAYVISKQYKKIFISYAHQDEEKVKFIAEAYKAQGTEYFFDRHYLKGGDVFPSKIQNFINSSDLFILCWSQNSSKSEYVQKERKQALRLAYPMISPREKAKLAIYPLSIEPHAELPDDMKDTYNFITI